MANLENLLGKFILTALLVFSIFAFIYTTQIKNNAPDPVGNNPLFNDSYRRLAATLNTTSSQAGEKYSAFNNEEPERGFGSLILYGIVSAGKTMSQITLNLFSVTIKLPLAILGIPSTIYNMIIAWLVITLIIALWLLYKLGG